MPPKPRFSLKSFMLAVTVACICAGALAALARRIAYCGSHHTRVGLVETLFWVTILNLHVFVCAMLSRYLVHRFYSIDHIGRWHLIPFGLLMFLFLLLSGLYVGLLDIP